MSKIGNILDKIKNVKTENDFKKQLQLDFGNEKGKIMSLIYMNGFMNTKSDFELYELYNSILKQEKSTYLFKITDYDMSENFILYDLFKRGEYTHVEFHWFASENDGKNIIDRFRISEQLKSKILLEDLESLKDYFNFGDTEEGYLAIQYKKGGLQYDNGSLY